ncbi:non-ribosomal peptide synthetase [Streptomyces roseifaciens]|uniref:non-ribosomal peptide synthetase n=1 Tax=Streptomyces roseifaciens TaxID=1488406 RepID=UPI000717E984|nr:non-ribosomal peptide synthetase [Streptomyces roseifaciens]
MTTAHDGGEHAVRPLHETFAAAAAAWPGRIAVSDGERRLTYAELDRAANRLAHRLVALGAGPEQLVALSCARTVDLVVGVLGILKAGAGYLPLDPRYPLERLRSTVADAGCRLAVGDEVPELGLTVVAPAQDDLAGEPDTAPAVGLRPEHVAYVIYTSGSTGRPKGVVVSHANAARLFTATEAEFGFGPDDVWTMFHSIAFDFSVWELWGALLYGGRVVVVPYELSRDPEAFVQLLVAERVTVLSQTPSAFRQLATAAEALGFPGTALRTVVFGGEKLEPATLRRWVEQYGDDRPRLINMYGITETTVHVTLRRITRADLDDRRSPIGTPLADLTLYVLDEELRPVAPGVQGELYVGGAGVARGYLNRPELTRERFLPDPFTPGGRLYRTGDLAEPGADGEVYYHGRADGQVQLRGFRIELGEIEATVLGHPDVREAVTVVREDEPGQQRLVCYWVGRGGAGQEDGLPAALREFTAGRLPAHMVPSAFVPMTALPMTPNGKLDRDALPRPEARVTPPAGPLRAPADSVEAQLATIWAEALGVPAVGTDDNFFAIGGDSMRAIPMVVRAKEAGLPVTVVALFAHPTVSALAAYCRAQEATAAQAEESGSAGEAGGTAPEAAEDRFLAGAPDGVEAAYPASTLQQGIIFHSKMSGDPTLYHDLESVRVHGPLDLGALRRALDALAGRHEILRTSFDLGSHRQVVQYVHAAAEIPLTVVTPAAGLDPDTALRRWWQEQWQERFDFTRAPLLRCHVLRHGDEDFHLAVSTHHSILDGWSFALLMTELLTGYDREMMGLTAYADDARPLPYREFVALEAREAGSDTAREYWTRLLDGATATRLPAPSGAPAAGGASAVGGRAPERDVTVVLPPELVARIGERAAALGAPVKSVFLAAHLLALGRVAATDDVVTGVVSGGRPEAASAEATLGLFLNSVPLRVDLAGKDPAGLVGAAFAAEQEMLPHRRYPLSRITRDVKATPFEVLFNFTSFGVVDALDDLLLLKTADWWLSDRNSFPVSVEIGRHTGSDQWRLDITTDPAKVAAGAAQELAAALEAALWELVSP